MGAEPDRRPGCDAGRLRRAQAGSAGPGTTGVGSCVAPVGRTLRGGARRTAAVEGRQDARARCAGPLRPQSALALAMAVAEAETDAVVGGRRAEGVRSAHNPLPSASTLTSGGPR